MPSATPRLLTAPLRTIFSGRPALAAYAAFAAFGVFWGAWGAALPALRSQAGLTEGQLGTALLFVGAGALPAMLLTGRALDRWGLRLAAPLLALLGAAGVVVGLVAHDAASVTAGMLLVGAASGTADVAINTLAADAEERTGRPTLSRGHGAFSLAVVGASLGAGALLAATTGAAATFATVAVVIAALAAVVGVTAPAAEHAGTAPPAEDASPTARAARRAGALPVLALVVLGLVGALAYAAENAHQSWSAVFVTDTFAASPLLASFAPATFAAAAAVARFTVAPLSRSRPLVLLVAGGTLATAGSVVVATSSGLGVALAGLALAAVGTATLFPTLLSHGLRHVGPGHRGRATSLVATTAYLGFLLGPAYVGFAADALGLRGAMLAVALLTLVLTVAAVPAGRWADRTMGSSHPSRTPKG
ncbi:MFS transporter [Cellulosimicrobium marinum]|uniref:MFS transporter n=1 Tax=Cellulosimicrobium marinum TaxID=1638992 RepID=UPI001E3B8EA3|nr:MFS transporter [Cellulosimicrobium marinum]MCB7136377.1 MFS transporter [Cellulosimicrobium marinum]